MTVSMSTMMERSKSSPSRATEKATLGKSPSESTTMRITTMMVATVRLGTRPLAMAHPMDPNPITDPIKITSTTNPKATKHPAFTRPASSDRQSPVHAQQLRSSPSGACGSTKRGAPSDTGTLFSARTNLVWKRRVEINTCLGGRGALFG